MKENNNIKNKKSGKYTIALAGNPNSGKTTLFNLLTGGAEYVGNWPGVTVEKKEGRLKIEKCVVVEDLPGIYSLSPYTAEEIVSRKYLVNEAPDIIINIIDGTNLERHLYLTTQILELGIPTVIALNMYDEILKRGDKINIELLSKELGCDVVPISALNGEGIEELINVVQKNVKEKKITSLPHIFSGSVEHAIAHIEESIQNKIEEKNIRWYAVKIFEKDEDAYNALDISADDVYHMKGHIEDAEKEMNNNSVSIIAKERYDYIEKLSKKVVSKNSGSLFFTMTDAIDMILTNKIIGIPIFIIIILLVYTIAMGPISIYMTDFIKNIFFGNIIGENLRNILTNINVLPWIIDLITDGIIGGVGTVLSFLPQMAILFILLSILEDSGYMARVAYLFDNIFRSFGLSGKSFIPMLIGTGCSVPAILSCRTIEDENDKRITLMLTSFMPCAAKMEIALVITSIFFNNNSIIATSMYFIGILIIILSGLIFKKLNLIKNNDSSFVIELPDYHMPSIRNVLLHAWDKIKGFIIKAGTVIFVSCVIFWFLMNFNMHFEKVDIDESILRNIGEFISIIFKPLGFGTWEGAVASISAFFAKEQAVATLGLIAHSRNIEIYGLFNGNQISAISFMLFNIFSAPCIVAVITYFKEHNNLKWSIITLLYQILVGYILAMIVYLVGSMTI